MRGRRGRDEGGRDVTFRLFSAFPPSSFPRIDKSTEGRYTMDWDKLLYWISLQIEYSESRLDELAKMRAIVEGLIENDENAEKKQNICADNGDIAAFAAPRL